MKTTRVLKTLGYGYVGFAAVNISIAWLTGTARTGRRPGDNRLLDLNDKLLKYNLLARIARIEPAYLTAPLVTLPDDVVTAPALHGLQGAAQFGRLN